MPSERELDRQARRELDAERTEHTLIVEQILGRDTASLTAELDRHFERVNEIMRAFVLRRRTGRR